MIKVTTTLFFVFTLLLLNAQSLDIVSQYALGSSGNDGLVTYVSPNGDGYYLIGNSDGNTSFDKSEDSRGGYDLWIVKTDNNFVKQWDKTYGGDDKDDFMNAVLFSDRIVINSASLSNSSGDKTLDLLATGGNYGTWNICTDLNGNILWQSQYGGNVGDAIGDMIKYSDTSVLMAMNSRSGISGNKTQGNFGFNDIWLVEAAISDGHIIKQNNVGSSLNEGYPKLIISPLTSKLYMSCISGSGVVDNDKTDAGFSNDDVWLTEIDNNLNVVRNKCFGGNSIESFVNITIDESDNIILAVTTQSDATGNKTAPRICTLSGGDDCWFLKVDSNFDMTWDKSYAGTTRQSAGSLFVLPTGEIVANCSSASNSGTGNKTSPYYGFYDVWVLFLDSNGDDILQATYGGSQYDFGGVIQNEADPTKFILTSTSNSPISGNKTISPKGGDDSWIAILDYNSTSGLLELSSNNDISAHPNPSQGSVELTFNELQESATLTFVTVDGKELESVELAETTNSYNWKTTYKGVVFYAISGQNTQLQGKLVFE